MPKICPKCGQPNKDSSISCLNCAYPLTKTNRDFRATVHAPKKAVKSLSMEPCKLKICPKCGNGNKPEQLYCTECSASLDESTLKEIKVDIEAEIRKDEKKEKLERRIIVISGGILVIALTLAAFLFGGDPGLFLPGIVIILLSILDLLYPEEMFKLSHLFSIKEVELSDFYYIANKIGAILMIVLMAGSLVLTLIFNP